MTDLYSLGEPALAAIDAAVAQRTVAVAILLLQKVPLLIDLNRTADARATVDQIEQLLIGDPESEFRDIVLALRAELDRDEKVERAEVRWRPGSWLVGVGAEHSDVSFADRLPGAVDRSNSGTAPVLEVSRLAIEGPIGYIQSRVDSDLLVWKVRQYVKLYLANERLRRRTEVVWQAQEELLEQLKSSDAMPSAIEPGSTQAAARQRPPVTAWAAWQACGTK